MRCKSIKKPEPVCRFPAWRVIQVQLISTWSTVDVFAEASTMRLTGQHRHIYRLPASLTDLRWTSTAAFRHENVRTTGSGHSPFTYEEPSRRFSCQTRSQQQENLQRWRLGGRANRRQSITCEFCCGNHTHTNSDVGPYHQKLWNLIVFPSWHLLHCLLHVRYLLVILRYLHSSNFASVVRNIINPPKSSGAYEDCWAFEFSHTAPLDYFRRISRSQWMSENDLRHFSCFFMLWDLPTTQISTLR